MTLAMEEEEHLFWELNVRTACSVHPDQYCYIIIPFHIIQPFDTDELIQN